MCHGMCTPAVIAPAPSSHTQPLTHHASLLHVIELESVIAYMSAYYYYAAYMSAHYYYARSAATDVTTPLETEPPSGNGRARQRRIN